MTHEELNKLNKRIEHMEAERAKIIGRMDEEIEAAKARGVDKKTLARKEEEREQRAEGYARFLKEEQAERDQLQAKLNEETGARQKEARDAMEKKRAEALNNWLENGGTEVSFTANWPIMEAEILRKKSLDALNEEAEAQARIIAAKKSEYGLL